MIGLAVFGVAAMDEFRAAVARSSVEQLIDLDISHASRSLRGKLGRLAQLASPTTRRDSIHLEQPNGPHPQPVQVLHGRAKQTAQ